MMRCVHVDELEQLAIRCLPPEVSEYFGQGAFAGVTTSAAPLAWDRLRLWPRVLRDVSAVSTATTVLGQAVTTPILVAPTALQRGAHPEGEVATARAAAAAGSLMTVSSNSGSTFEDIASTGVQWWLQVYIRRDRGLTKAMLERARAAGATALALTVDTPVVGYKRNLGVPANDFIPADRQRVNLDAAGLPDSALDQATNITPHDNGGLRDVTGQPVIVKGVLRADDARLAAEAGAAAVWVSNHGGRQLDQSVATAEALPGVVAALSGSQAEVYVDGGIRKAEHVLAALALGARAVFLGRPVLWALAAGGEVHQGGSAGVTDLLTGLTEELAHVMTIAGARDVGELTSDLVAC
jgi:4-hydroxymandelate oxidase